MDIVDKIKYEHLDVQREKAEAYRRIFNDESESAKIVLEDLIMFCHYQQYSDDPEIKNRIAERSTVIARIKAMLNGRMFDKHEQEELT